MVDAVVVGGGPAGLSAAAWLARYRQQVVVIDSGRYRNAAADRGHGYLGIDPMEPGAFRRDGRAGLLAYPSARIMEAEARRVTRSDDGFAVDTTGGMVETRRVVLATGVCDVLPDVVGFSEHYGASVFHCPSCDGYEARDREVVVIGWSAQVTDFAIGLLDWAASVSVITDGVPFEGDERHRKRLAEHEIVLIEGNAVELAGTRENLLGVHLANGDVVACDLMFFSIEHQANTDLARQLGCARDDEGYVVVDDCGATTVPGVYAAGDLTPGLQLVQVAAASGTRAGIGCAQSLLARDHDE